MLSILLPTKYRISQVYDICKSFIDNAYNKDNIEFIIGVDEDDYKNNKDLLEKVLNTWYKNIKIYIYQPFDNVGDNINKKYNVLYSKCVGDYILGIGDDVFMITKDYDKIIHDEYLKIGDDILVLGLYEGKDSVFLFKHIVCSRRFVEIKGYYCNENYKHYFVDNEITSLALSLGRGKVLFDVCIDHKHPVYNKDYNDNNYQNDYKNYFNRDKEVFEKTNNSIIQSQYLKFIGKYDSSIRINRYGFTKDLNVLIGMPCYGGLVNTDTLISLIELGNAGIRYGIFTVKNESLITRARNAIFSYFIEHPEYTHLLFLDADIGIKNYDVIKMLYFASEKGIDIIGAPVRLKDIERKVLNISEVYNNTLQPNGIAECKRLGNAVMMISRNLALDIAKYCDDNKLIYHKNSAAGGSVSEKYYDCFRVGVSNALFKDYELDKINEVPEFYLSEDFYLNALCRLLGYKIYVDLSIDTIHNGNLSLKVSDPIFVRQGA